MSRHHSFYDTVNQLAGDGVNKGILQLYTEDEALNGNTFMLKNQEVVNFGSCSYLGLEFDERLKAAAKKAVDDYGTQFSAARIYVSTRHYDELESKFEKIFDSPSLVAPTTTLGHIATIPVLLHDDDAVILDHQAHNSMQNAVNLMKFRGTHVEMIRHNNMEMLEERVKKLRQKHARIWYFADGIFSMYGDHTPIDDIYALMDKYPELYYYVDDAHGMSCYGKHGRGYVLSKKPIHNKMIFTTSLAKAFATGGAVLVFPNQEWADKVRNTGAPFLSSGPLQPASLGAALASADLHLSDEIYALQSELQENIKYTNLMLKKYGLPNVNENNSPVFFVGVGLPKMGFNMIKRLLNEGFYTNIGVFPTVPMKNTGMRFTITRLHTFEQIENMVAKMAFHYPLALEEEGFTMDKVYRAFKMTPPEEEKIEKAVSSLVNQSALTVHHEKTIESVDKTEWDELLGDRGSFDWEGLKFLEQSFQGNKFPENNWKFDYLIIKDDNNKVVLATFLTTAITKDDMLALTMVSKQIEKVRSVDDPYYLTSTTVMMGSPLTEGDHLYLDRSSAMWKDAMQILFDKLNSIQSENDANAINLRDLNPDDKEMDVFLSDNGFFKVSMPENSEIDNLHWDSTEEYLGGLSPSSKKHVKRYILKHEDKYEIEIVKNYSRNDLLTWYNLYLNVKKNSHALNTFTLPFGVFENMAKNKNWEIMTISLKPEFDKRDKREPTAVLFNYMARKTYNFIIIGMDYQYVNEFKCYKQALYQVVKRAKQLGMDKVRLGYTTATEKRKIGARIFTPAAYIQTKDNYNLEVLGTMSVLEKAMG